MSWQSYVDDHLMCQLNSGVLKSAALVGLEGGGVWAQSPAFPNITAEQYKNIEAGFDDTGLLAQKGLWIADQKFMVVQGDPGVVIRGRIGADETKGRKQGGICIKKTGSCLVFGIFEDPVTPGDCNIVVENLGDYLIGQGY